MSQPQSLLSDTLLGELMAVGEVDIVVGVPTLNNAATIGTVVSAVHTSFATDFLRQRTVLLNCDGGSHDGTPEIVRSAASRSGETLVACQSLRTIHRISTPYHGMPGRGGALRVLFAAAELLQARAVALIDPGLTSITPAWVARLVGPILQDRADYVSPLVPRHPLDGPLVSQLVRPLLNAAYGYRVHEPLASDFAVSGRFVAHGLSQTVWETPLAREGIDLWLTGTALSGGFRFVESPLGPRTLAPTHPRASLPETFSQVVGALFACLEAQQSFWLSRRGIDPLPASAPSPEAMSEWTPVDVAPMAESFRSGFADLAPVLEGFLAPATMARLQAVARDAGAVRYDDDLWVSTVHQALAGYHHQVMHRDHLVQALVPLYLGRVASFLEDCAGLPPAAASDHIDRLSRRFDEAKPDLVLAWSHPGGR